MQKYLVLALLSSFICFSQNKSGTVIYDLYISMDDATMEIDKKYGYIQKAIDASNELDYILVFKNHEANFHQEENNTLDNTSKYMANVMCNVSSKNYINIEKKYILKEVISDSYLIKKNEFVIKDTLNYTWEITKESKLIGDYLCFKATTKKKTPKIVNDQEKEFYELVTAWFCPSLPYSFGPANYANLPGLILELQEKNSAFVVKKIDLTSDVTIEIPKGDKVISQEEQHEIFRNRMELLMDMTEQK